ncbi:S-layer family protein, partial [Geitlerinema sp. CS-897]|nr:S-layer family protein [Geitlerinema sp. CS-897]
GRGLQVSPGQTLALVGGNVLLDGATLTAQSGHIELGSVEVGLVSLTAPQSSESQPWRFNYDGVSGFRDVRLVRQAAADASGTGVGSMQIVGRQIALSDGSIALLQNQGTQTFGQIRVRASESLTLTGTIADGSIPTSLYQETLGTGNSGDIEISTTRLVLVEGANIINRTQDTGNSGKIDVRAADSIEAIGISPLNPAAFSFLGTATAGMGSAGDITIATRHLRVRDGAGVYTATFASTGAAGDLIVNATETVESIGVNPIVISPSAITSASVGAGNAGRVIINTSRAIVRDGARISSSTIASGNGGILILNATESVEVSGTVAGSINPSLIDASATLNNNEATVQAFGLPPITSGSSGNLEINTPQLNVLDGGDVTVRNDGIGRAGNLQVNAEAIFLNEGGGITASTRSGEGGNVFLQVGDSLQLRHGSQISAEAGGSGNGGNLEISANTIALLEGSRINANAFEGQGGNIEIATQSLFASPDSRITASSQLGVDGIVAVTQPEIDTSSALVQLSSAPIDPTTQIVSACSAAHENSFVATGSGGLPPNPLEPLRGQAVWFDWPDRPEAARRLETDGHREADRSQLDRSPTDALHVNWVEANRWRIDGNGNAELVSSQSRNAPFMPLECLSER